MKESDFKNPSIPTFYPANVNNCKKIDKTPLKTSRNGVLYILYSTILYHTEMFKQEVRELKRAVVGLVFEILSVPVLHNGERLLKARLQDFLAFLIWEVAYA